MSPTLEDSGPTFLTPVEPPRGPRTSEFWLSCVGLICLLALVLADKLDVQTAIGLGGIVGGYSISRGLAKGRTWALVAVSLAFLLAGAGCASSPATPGTSGTSTASKWLSPPRVQAIARLAAYSGTLADLRSHPEHRAQYETAARQLQVFVDSGQWDATAAATALAGSGIQQLQGSEGALILQGGLLLTDAIGIGQYDARSQEHVRAAILGILDGLNMALWPGGELHRGIPANADEQEDALRADAIASRTDAPNP